jgi:GNAT superfamily N-acetyltransferase
MEITYRKATIFDISCIVIFVDSNLPHKDFFIPPIQHIEYLKRYCVLLAFDGQVVIGWGVCTDHKVLIHLLIAPPYRGRGIGSEMIRILAPELIRSKMDQSTGNPEDFYKKLGFVKITSEPIGKKKNIELFSRPASDTAPT